MSEDRLVSIGQIAAVQLAPVEWLNESTEHARRHAYDDEIQDVVAVADAGALFQVLQKFDPLSKEGL